MKKSVAIFALALFCSLTIADEKKDPPASLIEPQSPLEIAASNPSAAPVPSIPLSPLQSQINELLLQRKQIELSGGDASAIDEEIAQLREPRDGGSLDDGADNCPVVVITSVPYTDTGTTVGKTNNHTPTCSSSNAPDVVYDYMPSYSGMAVFSLCGSGFDTILDIWQGPCPGFTWVGCSDDYTPCGLQSLIEVYVYAGEHYTIWVDGFSTNAGNYTLFVDGPRPQGDYCGNALPLEVPGYATGSTCGFANDFDYACPWTGNASDVVYSYTPTTNQNVTFSLCESSYDTKLFVYQDDCTGVPIACSDDAANCPCADGPYRSYIECVSLLAGHTYYVVVDGYASACGNHVLLTSICYPCDVTQQPSDLLEVAENCADPNFFANDPDGGLNRTPPQFAYLDQNEVVFGTVFNYWVASGLYRDTDWYMMEPLSGDSVIASIYSETYLLLMLYDTTTHSHAQYINVEPCTPTTVRWPAYTGSTYCLFVATSQGFSDYRPHATGGRNYRLTYELRSAPPPNDNCSGAIPLTVNAPSPTCSNNVGATLDCDQGSSMDDPEVWYSFSLTQCSRIVIEFCGTGLSDLIPEVYQNSCCGSLYEMNTWSVNVCPDGSRTWENYVLPGQYLFPVRLNPQGPFCVRVSEAPGPPANDNCENAQTVSVGSWLASSTLCATMDGSPECGNISSAPGVWYKVIGNGQTIRASTCQSSTNFDTRLSVFTCDCSGLECIVSNDDDVQCTDNPLASTVTWCSREGEEYLILVHGYNGGVGRFFLSITNAPEIPCSAPWCCPDQTVYVSPSSPQTLVASTAGMGDDCDYLPTEDYLVRVVIEDDNWYRFSSCDSPFNTRLFVSDDCCTDVFRSAYSWCAPPDGPQKVCVELPPSIVFVTIEGANGGGVFQLDIEASAPPPQVTGVQASDNRCSGVLVTWNDVNGEYRYHVMRNGSLIATVPANATTFFDSLCAPGTYVYTVMAENSCLTGPISAGDSGTRLAAPTPVSDLVTQIWNGDAGARPDDIRLTWTAQAGFGGTYSIYMNPDYANYPGTGWTLLASNIPPVFGDDAMHYVHYIESLTASQLFYVVIPVCL